MDQKTGKELLEDKLRLIGATQNQIESKIVAMMVTVFAEVDNPRQMCLAYLDAKDEYKKLAKELEEERRRIKNDRFILNREISNFNYTRDQIEEELNRKQEEVDQARKEIFEAETPEMRDRMRLAKYFEMHTDPQNGYQETAFINGLANILAGLSTEPCKETA